MPSQALIPQPSSQREKGEGWFILLIVWFVLALISQPVLMKIYAALSVVSVIVVEAAIRKRRKKANADGSLI